MAVETMPVYGKELGEVKRGLAAGERHVYSSDYMDPHMAQRVRERMSTEHPEWTAMQRTAEMKRAADGCGPYARMCQGDLR